MTVIIARHRRHALAVAILCAILGIVLVAKHWHHMGKHQWEGVVLPFKMNAGETIAGEFTAALDTPYEIEVEIDWSLPSEVLDRLFYVMDKPAPLDIEWSVTEGETVVSRGDCRDYVSINLGGNSAKDKIRDHLLKIPFHRDYPNGTIARGIGRVKAEAGKTYKLTAKVNASQEELNAANPRFIARVNQVYWSRHLHETKTAAFAGSFFCGLAFLAILWWLLGTLIHRKRSR